MKTYTVTAGDGRELRVYDTGDPRSAGGPVLIWQHGTPQTGEPPMPLLPEFERRGLRCVSYDRPGYGCSDPWYGRNIASAAADVAAIADALEIAEFVTVGLSSGGPPALACAALLPDRVVGVVSVASPAPIDAEGLDWFAGMGAAATARMSAGTRGRAAIETHLRTVGFAADIPTMSDVTVLVNDWSWLSGIAQQAMAEGFRGAVDDVLSMVTPWGFQLPDVHAPVLVVHGASDRVVPVAHGQWLAGRCERAELWSRPGDGHSGVLTSCSAALDWLTGDVAGSPAT